MNVSAKTEYACIAVLELAARHAEGDPVRIRDIADSHGIPSRFLVQILLQLKSAGFVASIRGATGGYRLAKEPDEITLHEVMSVVDSQSAGTIKSSADRNTTSVRVLLNAWRAVAAKEREMLADITFADLVRQLQGRGDPMYHI
jgi:Rrf2 family protein